MAHALYGYQGACKNIHGHSYELHITIESENGRDEYIPGPGLLIDFKEIKKIVNAFVIKTFDHKLILSRDFVAGIAASSFLENPVIWEIESTAENMLIYIKKILCDKFPDGIKLTQLKLYETNDSYAEMFIE
jgi:6-pyruvoyltetrahydropterin/6-carboxytetrahydropterin synthase